MRPSLLKKTIRFYCLFSLFYHSKYIHFQAYQVAYLPSDMSVKRMYELFKAQNHSEVSYSLYYSVFTKKFNLGFGHPATDACATCTEYKLSLKDPHMTEEEKRTKTAMFILHRRTARVFYDLLGRVEDDATTVCFDMMQNMTLPEPP